MAQTATTKDEVAKLILDIAASDGETRKAFLEMVVEALPHLAQCLPDPSTKSNCSICSSGMHHYLGEMDIAIGGMDKWIQAGGVLRAIQQAQKEGWLLGRVEQMMAKEKEEILQTQRSKKLFSSIREETLIEGVPTLGTLTVRTPVYICTQCGALALGGVAGFKVLSEK